MKIKSASINNKKRCLEIQTLHSEYHLPFSKLRLRPSFRNKIKDIYIDPKLAKEAVTYVLESGEEDSVHLDEFKEYHQDADHMLELMLYQLTLKASQLVKRSKLGIREISRKLGTSPSQLYRLLDSSNSKKSIDQMFKLIHHLGGVPKLKIESPADNFC